MLFRSSANVQISFNVTDYPGDAPTVYGPYTVTQSTEFFNTRFRGRLVAINVASSPALTAADMANVVATRNSLRGWRIINASAINSAGIMGIMPSRMAIEDKNQMA